MDYKYQAKNHPTYFQNKHSPIFAPRSEKMLWKHLKCPGGEPACRQAGLVDAKFFLFSKPMFFVYAIKSVSRNYIYVGLTNDVEKRFKQHNNGENRSTKAYLPFSLLYSEIVPDRIMARKREKYLKSGVGKEFLRSLI